MQDFKQSIHRIQLIIIITALITSIIVGGGVFFGLKFINRKSIRKLQFEINNLQKRISDLEDREKTRQEFNTLAPIIENKLPDWVQRWQTMVLGFNINIMTWQEETTITAEPLPFNPNDTLAKLRTPFYVYSPDKTKFLDIYLGIELWDEAGKLKAGYGPDHAVGLTDLKTNQFKVLLFCGTTGNYDEALWLDNDRFVITGFSEYFPKSEDEQKILGNKTYYVAFLYYFNLRKNKMTLYYGPKVEGIFFQRIYLRSLSERFRNKFPNIIFD